MTDRQTGGAAFPVPSYVNVAGETHDVEFQGMTLRDYFAAAALQGLCAGFSAQDRDWPRDDEPEGYDVAAEHAYQMADAMLKARDAKS